MQLTQSKLVQFFLTALVFVALFSSAAHAKDVVAPKHHKIGKDDSGSTARKVLDDSHNHSDKFSFKSMKASAVHTFSADSRSLKKQFMSDKKLQSILD